MGAQRAHDAFGGSRELSLPSFHSSNRQREQKVLGAYCRGGVEKNPLCWYWFLLSCSCDMFSHCHRACTVRQASVFGNLERSCCEGPLSWWWCGWTWFVQSQQKDSETVVIHGGPAVPSGVTQEQRRAAGWLAVSTLHHSPYLLGQILLFTQRFSVPRRTRSPNWLE